MLEECAYVFATAHLEFFLQKLVELPPSRFTLGTLDVTKKLSSMSNQGSVLGRKGLVRACAALDCAFLSLEAVAVAVVMPHRRRCSGTSWSVVLTRRWRVLFLWSSRSTLKPRLLLLLLLLLRLLPLLRLCRRLLVKAPGRMLATPPVSQPPLWLLKWKTRPPLFRLPLLPRQLLPLHLRQPWCPRLPLSHLSPRCTSQ